jgi:hypothetical protein
MNPPALCLRGSRRRGLPRNPAGGEKAEPSGDDMPVQPPSYLITLSYNSTINERNHQPMKSIG